MHPEQPRLPRSQGLSSSHPLGAREGRKMKRPGNGVSWSPAWLYKLNKLVCCWFSSLLREDFLRVLRFPPFLKNQHFQIPTLAWKVSPISARAVNTNLWLITAVIHTTSAVVVLKPEKNLGLNGIWTHDLCDIGTEDVCITAMINHKFISFSAVQIYHLSYIHLQCQIHWHLNKVNYYY